MKHALAILTIGAGLLAAVAHGVPDAQIETLLELPEQSILPALSEAPRIDGSLDDWNPEQALVLDVSPSARPPEDHLVSPSNPFGGDEDLSARIFLAWDEDNLYVGARVRDDHLRGMAHGTAHDEGPDGWACDGILLSLHSFRQPIERHGPHALLALRYAVPEGGRGETVSFRAHPDTRWKLTPGSRLASQETGEGYQVEAAIPWGDLRFQAVAGEPLRVGVLVVDVDPDQPLKQLAWNWHAPRTLRLAGKPDPQALGLLSLAHERLVPGQERQAALFQVDALQTDVRVDAIRLEGPGNLERVVPVGKTVPAGRRGNSLVFFDAFPSAPGAAAAHLETTVDGRRTVLASRTFEIAPPAETSPPAVSGPAGEIVRQPPERTWHHAQADRRRGRIRYQFIREREGYEPWILEHVRPAVDALEGTLEEQYLVPEGNRRAAHQILRALVLHRLTGAERYAAMTRMLIEAQLRHIETTGDHLPSLIWPRYFTWQQDPESPLAPPDAELRYAAAWAAAAAEPPDWTFQEWGYHNRCWNRWRQASLMLHFAGKLKQPADPRLAEYVAWHDENLLPVPDTLDNSSGYNWHGLLYLLQTRAATGALQELRTNDAFWKVAGRLRDYFSPGGVLPNWGDTSGWMTGGEHFADLELLARLSGDGRFRYVAHRVAEYYCNFMWQDPRQYHGPADRAFNAFAAAWLHADETVAPRPPDAASQILFKPRTLRLTSEEMQARPGLRFGRLGEPVPDKAVLKSGNDPFGLWAFVELLDFGGHAGNLPGNVAALLDQGAALYAGQGYWDTGQGDNNVVWIEDLEGMAAAAEPMRAEVPRFAEDRALTWLQVRVLRYADLPITATRDILFVKNGFLVVRDSLEFHAAMRLRLGPAWHTRNLGPQSGDDWFNAYYDRLYHTGLGVGRGVHVWPNPAWDLMIAFAPRQDTAVGVDDRYDENPWRVSPVRLRQAWNGFVRSGERRTFVTALLPHPPAFDVRPFRERLDFRVDTEDGLLVSVPRFNNARNAMGGNLVTLQLHAGPGMLEHGDWSSDAAVAMVERRPDGTIVQTVIVDGARLTDGGHDLSEDARVLASQAVWVLEE